MAVTTHHALPTSNNVNKPNVKRLVYNMYRDMLGSYNDKANDIVDSLPRRMVREDQGITKQIESMIQQQTNSANSGDYGNDQPCFAGPPPPPPPPGPCNLPSKRLSTEIPDRRLEPPACVQNAMMTKDKKPFTYTPGGLDLSQIKSPRMARRINRNAQAEGVSESRQSPLAQPPGQLPPSALAAMQPNLPTPVFPPGGIPPPPPPPSNAGPIQSSPSLNNNQPSVNKPVPPPQNFQRPDIKNIIPPNPTAMLRQTGGPMRRGPYPPEPIDEPTSPEKLQTSNNAVSPSNKPQLGSLYIPPVKNQEIEENRNIPSNIQSPVKNIHTPPTVQSPVLNKAPTPWLTQRTQPQQSNVPAWAHREDSEPKSPPTVISKVAPVQIDQTPPKSNNISIQIQHRPQVYVVNPPQQQYHPMSPGPQTQKNSRIIPIQIEGSNSPTQMSPGINISRNDSVNQPQWKPNGNIQRTQEIPSNQFRKLQLQDDDQNLMNRFKNQVDEDTFLHNETDPRYRGAAIPSRAFRMLQTMTDTGSDPIPQYSNAPRNSSGPVVRTIPIQREGDDGNVQQYIPPSEQQAPAEPRKYTGSTIPSRSFRMLQAMTSPNNTPCANTQSTENVENYANDPYYSQWGGYDPNYPPHPYWNNPYWAYYSQHCYSPQLQECQDESQTGDQNEQPEQDINAQYQQYWDQYGYYYNYYPYPYPPVYSPHPFYHQNSDTDNEGAYSSCDEMTYYGALFANKPPKIPQKIQSKTPDIIVTSESSPENKIQNNDIKNVEKTNSTSDSSESESDSESDADTEVEDQKPIKTKSGSLLAIKSVSDINIYEDNNNYPDTTNPDQQTNDVDSNDDSTEENDDEYSIYEEEEIPHQLSVIFEDDNEVSDYESVRGKKPRQDSEHTLVSEEESFVTVGNGESDTDEEVAHTQSTVTVKLPLKLKCSRNEQNEPITTITVEPTSEVIETHVTLKSPTPCKDKPKEDVSFTINIPSHKNSFETQNNLAIDNQLKADNAQDSDVSVSVSLSLKKISNQNNDSSNHLKCETNQEFVSESENESNTDNSDEGSSSSSGDSSSDSSSESESEIENVKDENNDMNKISDKEKQQILKLLAKAKGIEKDETISMNVKDKIKSFEMHIRKESSNSRRNSSKSIVDVTDEEDSGVTSDMSRHISDTDSSECFPELRKMNKYRRAATHSRLFQLLQEEYNSKEEDGNETQNLNENIISVKESLTLPLTSGLHNDQEESSSGINSPISPTVNDRLVKELVQSLLKRKKGKCFRNLPLEKLHAAALRILQEDMDRYDTISSSEDGGSTAFLSPLPTETVNSSPVQTPQEFFNGNYDDYSAYYSSWANIASDTENYDILPSRTFKLLQDHATGTKPLKNTILAKCPRVLSGKNLHKELQKVTETRETPSPLLESNPDNKIEARAT